MVVYAQGVLGGPLGDCAVLGARQHEQLVSAFCRRLLGFPHRRGWVVRVREDRGSLGLDRLNLLLDTLLAYAAVLRNKRNRVSAVRSLTLCCASFLSVVAKDACLPHLAPQASPCHFCLPDAYCPHENLESSTSRTTAALTVIDSRGARDREQPRFRSRPLPLRVRGLRCTDIMLWCSGAAVGRVWVRSESCAVLRVSAQKTRAVPAVGFVWTILQHGLALQSI